MVRLTKWWYLPDKYKFIGHFPTGPSMKRTFYMDLPLQVSWDLETTYWLTESEFSYGDEAGEHSILTGGAAKPKSQSLVIQASKPHPKVFMRW